MRDAYSGIHKKMWIVIPHYPTGKQPAFFTKKQALKWAIRREAINGKRPWVLVYRFAEKVEF